jgi:hypothetical protein
MSLLNQSFGKRGTNNLRQRFIYESAFEISPSNRICIAAVREFLSNSMQIFFFMKETI